MKAYVYAVQGPPEALQRWASSLGEPLYHWVADAARLAIGEGIPENWKDQGAIFGPKGELRWRREGPDYFALLFTDGPVSSLIPLDGEWTVWEVDFFLQNLRDRKLRPNFNAYPHGLPDGQCRAKVYYRNGTATFISLRTPSEKGGDDAGN